MVEIDKVIGNLEKLYCLDHYNECFDTCGEDNKQAIRDAIALLNQLKPRVMTLEEIKDGESYWFRVGKEFVTRPVICVHREDDARKQYITFVGQFGTFSCEIDDYGKTWSCWTARPTWEQI